MICPECQQEKSRFIKEKCRRCYDRLYQQARRERLGYKYLYIENREYQAQWRAANPTKLSQLRRRAYLKKRERRREALQARVGRRCADCGDRRKSVLEYHHIEAPELRNIYGGSEAQFEAELPKLIALCANCHTIRHRHAGRKEGSEK